MASNASVPTYHHKITSSTSITKLVSTCLSELFPAAATSGSSPEKIVNPPLYKTYQLRPAPVVHLSGKSGVASKAISIAEIVKRRLQEQNLIWYQYTGVGEIVVEIERERGSGGKKKKDSKVKGEGARTAQGDGEAVEEEEGDDESGEEGEDVEGEVKVEDPFQRLSTPGLHDGNPTKKRAIPMINIYLSRGRIEEYASLYGEQSNAPKKR